MFNFFRKFPPAPPLDNSPWRCRMGWQVVTYQEGDHGLSLQLEPMKSGPCRIRVPGENAWAADAGSPGRFTREQAKRAWFAAVEQMCLQVAGPVDLDETTVILGSVFHEIVLPTLRRNPNVTLSFAGAR